MTPTPDQIASAARLVPEYAAFFHYSDGEIDIVQKGTLKQWQPTADTEAGRSDALVLLAAVKKYLLALEQGADAALIDAFCALCDAEASGNVQQIQAATVNAAVAIGEYLQEQSK